MKIRLIAICACAFLLVANISAQDIGRSIERIGKIKENKFSINGGVQLSADGYSASGIDARQDNLQWRAQANLRLNFMGFSAPFSFAFSEANATFNLPSYTFAGISPTYKWATVHAGDRSMAFSRYTMSGISFRGAGISLEPGNFHFSGFYGKLNRGLASDLNAVGELNGLYDRTGYGLRTGYAGKNTAAYLNFFGADDDDDGTPPITALNEALKPTANKVISLELRQRLAKRLTLSGEFAHSAFNADQNAPALATGEMNAKNELFGLFKPNETTTTGQAYNIAANAVFDNFGLQARYERITRNFRTLGALFFNNDTESITAGLNRSFLENKLSVIVNAGLERTDLEKLGQQSTDRIIGSVNISYMPNAKWMFGGGYSNFRNDTKLRARTDLAVPIDSIFLAQVNQTIQANVIRQLGSDLRPANLRFLLQHQRANSIINEVVMENANSQVTVASVSYSSGNPEVGWQYNVGLTANLTEISAFTNRSVAPTVGLSRNFLDGKATSYLQSAFSFQSRNGDANQIFNLSLGGSYRLESSHRLGLRASHLNRIGGGGNDPGFSEWYGSISYGYSFGGKIGGKKNSADNE